MNMRRLVLSYRAASRPPYEVLLEGRKLGLSPLEKEALDLLARADGDLVDRLVLMTRIDITQDHLYKLIHGLRRKLGEHRHRLEQVGSSSRRGGESGYRLTGLELEFRHSKNLSSGGEAGG